MGLVTHLRMIYGVAYLSSRFIIRQPAWLIQSVLSYIGFAILLYMWGGIEGLKNLIVAMIVGGLWSTGVNIVAQSVGWDRVSKIHDMFVVSPARPIHYILGYFLSAMVFPLSVLATMLPLVYVLNAWNIAIASLAMGIVTLLVGIEVGLYIVLRVDKPMNVSAITNPISWLLTILPPVYYPLALIPQKFRLLALIAPTASAAELARQLSGIEVAVPTLAPVLVLTAWVTLGTYLLIKTMRWGLE